MRGTDKKCGSLFSYVDLEDRLPVKHPLRKIRPVVNDALAGLDAEFKALHMVPDHDSHVQLPDQFADRYLHLHLSARYCTGR